MAETQGDVTFKFRRGTAAQWSLKNPVLARGEPGLALGQGNFKIGDGRTHWNDLPYFLDFDAIAAQDDSSALAALQNHILSTTPHTVYDDGPSLVLLYEIAKV
jgi:hypothetical protein